MNKTYITLPIVISFVFGIGIGWIVNYKIQEMQVSTNFQIPLRSVGNYQFTSPLLACDSSFDGDSPSLKMVKDGLEQVIAKDKQEGNISEVSVYFRYLISGEEFNIDPEGRFFPASLKKLPLMMQYYKESEFNPSLLTEKRLFDSKIDGNIGTIIPPKEFPINGQEYTAEELMGYMIRNSDNNSFNVLYPALGEDKFDKIYKDMQLKYPNSFTAKEDYVTSYEVSLFFRALYNATYLNPENSEKALKLLSEADYKQALARELPGDVLTAHKFGVAAINDVKGNPVGELHDCGIVYKKNNPYFICVMTKSSSIDFTKVEDVVARISKYVYEQAK